MDFNLDHAQHWQVAEKLKVIKTYQGENFRLGPAFMTAMRSLGLSDFFTAHDERQILRNYHQIIVEEQETSEPCRLSSVQHKVAGRMLKAFLEDPQNADYTLSRAFTMALKRYDWCSGISSSDEREIVDVCYRLKKMVTE